jgi:hypothetical protein
MDMPNLRKWVDHTPMSDPAVHAEVVAELSPDIGVLNSVVQGVLIHTDWLTEYGLDGTRYAAASRATLSVVDRLNAVLQTDSQSLKIARQPEKRQIGTCRDFALMLCSLLRSKGIPARVRCGFAAYFGSGWEDHWVCEYWHEQSRRWLLSDAQIDKVQKEKCRIEFDPRDVPRNAFMTAGEAWLGSRSGTFDPNQFGQGQVTGRWFIKINVVRDHYVLNGRETSEWDTWRTAQLADRVVCEDEAALLDDLAARPEQPLATLVPDWLKRD